MVILIDNYDSFVYNLARMVVEQGHAVQVLRNDAYSAAQIWAMQPSHIVLSPGPKTPNEAGVCDALLQSAQPATPILGVCLGLQCIGAAFGGQVVRARQPMHGKTSLIQHGQQGIFAGLPSPLRVARYHSLVVAADQLPACLAVTAYSEQGEIMGLQHRNLSIHGVQFHPEAVLTECGADLLQNFLALAHTHGSQNISTTSISQ
jgi:anthranilate synthase component 2